MSFALLVIPLVQSGTIKLDQFAGRLSYFRNSLKQQNAHWLAQQFITGEFQGTLPNVIQEYREVVVPAIVHESPTQTESKEVLTLAGAWNMYKREKSRNWTKVIAQANERFMEVLFVVLGASTDVNWPLLTWWTSASIAAPMRTKILR